MDMLPAHIAVGSPVEVRLELGDKIGAMYYDGLVRRISEGRKAFIIVCVDAKGLIYEREFTFSKALEAGNQIVVKGRGY